MAIPNLPRSVPRRTMHRFHIDASPSNAQAMAQPSFLAASVYVALGGGLGSWLRYAVGRLIGGSAFPSATLTVNIAGSFAMGLLVGWLARSGEDSEGWRLLLGVGMLGGFTTFSAFSLDIVTLVQRGAIALAVQYIVLSLAGGVAGLIAGLALIRAAA